MEAKSYISKNLLKAFACPFYNYLTILIPLDISKAFPRFFGRKFKVLIVVLYIIYASLQKLDCILVAQNRRLESYLLNCWALKCCGPKINYETKPHSRCILITGKLSKLKPLWFWETLITIHLVEFPHQIGSTSGLYFTSLH